MNSNEPIYELSADQNRAHEAFFNQHFVGKRLTYNPHAPLYHITFADGGTAVYVTDTSRDNSYDVNMRDHQNAGTIERAWIDEIEKWDDDNTYTQRLYVQCVDEDEPRLLAEATFIHEPYEDWEDLCLVAFDKDEW